LENDDDDVVDDDVDDDDDDDDDDDSDFEPDDRDDDYDDDDDYPDDERQRAIRRRVRNVERNNPGYDRKQAHRKWQERSDSIGPTLRKDFIYGDGQLVHQTKDSKLLNEMLTNSFKYVHRNGWLGDDSCIYVDGWRQDHQLKQHHPLAAPRSHTMNHGIHPLSSKLADMMPDNQINKWVSKLNKRRARIKNDGKYSTLAYSALPDDIFQRVSTDNLPHVKTSMMKLALDTTFDPVPTFDPPGFKMNMTKGKYDTWKFPYTNTGNTFKNGVANTKSKSVCGKRKNRSLTMRAGDTINSAAWRYLQHNDIQY
jgi:hypothetical protein